MTKEFAIDNASLLFLALMRKKYTNIFRFSMTLKEPIRPDVLQTAVDRIYRRFPTIICGFRPGFFHYIQFPAKQPPQVQPDPGCLITMPISQIHTCAFRVFYQDKTISIEAFHATTDGYGATVCISTLVAEYLRLLYGMEIPPAMPLRSLEEDFQDFEVADDFITHQGGKPLLVPSRYAYQIPGDAQLSQPITTTCHSYLTKDILDAAHRYGVSANTLISTVMATSVMEMQVRHQGENAGKPVRIMVPCDLRRLYASRTLRNFVLYTLPTMEPSERHMPIEKLMQKFQHEIRSQMDKSRLSSIMAYNVGTQRAWYFRMMPWVLKRTALRIGYRFFGESNSSITVTNLGNVKFPEQMQAHVEDFQVMLTPRVSSPFGCTVMSYGDKISMNVCSFCRESELNDIFREHMARVLS